jgi:hypothetical protein
MLRLVAALWAAFADALLQQSSILDEQAALLRIFRQTRRSSAWVAIELRGLLEQPIILSNTPVDLGSTSIVDHFGSDAVIVRLDYAGDPRKAFTRDTIPSELAQIATQVERLQLGLVDSSVSIPNMVFMDSETRQLGYDEFRVRSSKFRTPPSEPYFDWLAGYNPRATIRPKFSRRSTGSYTLPLEQMLRNLKVRDPERFYDTVSDINTFLIGKRITDFNDRLDLVVETNLGEKHTIYELSSGERQCLLLMFMVSRWTMPSGVVLIDEPDLHMHVSLQRQFIHQLESLIERRNGQLIVTSHSPELWEEYNPRQRFDFGEHITK